MTDNVFRKKELEKTQEFIVSKTKLYEIIYTYVTRAGLSQIIDTVLH